MSMRSTWLLAFAERWSRPDSWMRGALPFNPAARLPCVCIVDDSVIPGALATHPTLRITAQALSAMDTALRE